MKKIDTYSLIRGELLSYWWWFVDQGLTPELVCESNRSGVQIPEYLRNQRIVVLNISREATSSLTFGQAHVLFRTTFGGSPEDITIPYEAVLGMKASEFTSDIGMFSVIDFVALSQMLNGAESSQNVPDVSSQTGEPSIVRRESSVTMVDFTRKKGK